MVLGQICRIKDKQLLNVLEMVQGDWPRGRPARWHSNLRERTSNDWRLVSLYDKFLLQSSLNLEVKTRLRPGLFAGQFFSVRWAPSSAGKQLFYVIGELLFLLSTISLNLCKEYLSTVTYLIVHKTVLIFGSLFYILTSCKLLSLFSPSCRILHRSTEDGSPHIEWTM